MLRIEVYHNGVSVDYDANCKKQLIVMRGLPGSGKSFVADAFRNKAGCAVFSTDDFFMVNGHYRFDPTQLTQAHQTTFRKFVEAVNKEVEVIVIDNTNIHASEFAPYMTYAAAYGYETRLVSVWCPLQTAMDRQSHGVPAEVMIRMNRDLDRNDSIPPWYDHQVILNHE
jgi:predicted kinase